MKITFILFLAIMSLIAVSVSEANTAYSEEVKELMEFKEVALKLIQQDGDYSKEEKEEMVRAVEVFVQMRRVKLLLIYANNMLEKYKPLALPDLPNDIINEPLLIE